MAIAIPTGTILAMGLGGLTLLTGVARGEQALIIAGLIAFTMCGGLIGLVWALIVDRTTLHGAIDRPEESIESTWLNSAMASALGDTIALTGLATVVLTITGAEVDAIWALVGVICVAFFSTSVRYLVARKRG